MEVVSKKDVELGPLEQAILDVLEDNEHVCLDNEPERYQLMLALVERLKEDRL